MASVTIVTTGWKFLRIPICHCTHLLVLLFSLLFLHPGMAPHPLPPLTPAKRWTFRVIFNFWLILLFPEAPFSLPGPTTGSFWSRRSRMPIISSAFPLLLWTIAHKSSSVRTVGVIVTVQKDGGSWPSVSNNAPAVSLVEILGVFGCVIKE